MPSSSPRTARSVLVGVVVVALAAGCSGSHRTAAPRPATGGPTTTLIETDRWSAPVVSGPPSVGNFCVLLTAIYQHEAQLPLAANTTVKQQIIGDYVATVPKVEAAAPPDIAAAAKTYLDSVATVLQALSRAGLDYKKVPPGSLTEILLDPKIKAAGTQVLAYSQAQCHYSIGGT